MGFDGSNVAANLISFTALSKSPSCQDTSPQKWLPPIASLIVLPPWIWLACVPNTACRSLQCTAFPLRVHPRVLHAENLRQIAKDRSQRGPAWGASAYEPPHCSESGCSGVRALCGRHVRRFAEVSSISVRLARNGRAGWHGV